MTDLSGAVIASARKLADALRDLSFSSPVAHVYHPLDYAWDAHEIYLRRFAATSKRTLFLGMNPGPYGMTQTGVPFGEIAMVREWLKIHAELGKPDHEHPKRPIDGFACKRSEVSGRRLWSCFAERFGSPEAFFADHLVVNYCPLVWMAESGANITPDKLRADEIAPVNAACQEHLIAVIETLSPSFVIGVGAYAEKRLQQVASLLSFAPTIGKVLHPSPASPLANRGWAEAAEHQLITQGVWPAR